MKKRKILVLLVLLIFFLLVLAVLLGTATGKRSHRTNKETTTEAVAQEKDNTKTKNEKTSEETEETTTKEKKTKKETETTTQEETTKKKETTTEKNETTTVSEESSSETKTEQETTTAPDVQAMSGILYTTSSANVRAGAGTSYDAIGRLSSGTQVSITGKSGEWYRISYGNSQGYVHESLLSSSEPQTQATTQVTTQAATQAATQPVTQATTQATTQAPTQAATQPATQAPSQSSTTTSAYVDEVIRLVNIERNNAGLSSLTKNTTLCQAAQKRAGELPTLFSHTRPDGTDCFTVFNEYQISYYTAGENIAAGQRTPQEVVEGWMNSPGHRQNILNPDFNQIGVGCEQVSDTYGVYWTQLFIGS